MHTDNIVKDLLIQGGVDALGFLGCGLDLQLARFLHRR
jgi:hypothetical protein